MATLLTVGGVPPPTGPGSDNSPYYYGSGGTMPYQQPIPQPYGSTAPYAGTIQPPEGGWGGQVAPPAPTPFDPATVVAPPAPGGQFGGSVDYGSMIGGSWEVAQAEAMMAQQMARARDAFQGDLRSAFIDLGYTGDQSKLGNLSQYLDQPTIQAAIDNKYSLYNQIQQQQVRAQAQNNATLASRGILSSGQTTKSATDVLSSTEQARYDALRNFLQQGASGLTHLGDVESQMANAVAQARFAAAQRLAAMYPAYGPTGYAGGAPSGTGVMPAPDWSGYPGGVWPYDTGWLVPAGNATSTSPGDPYYVSPSSGTGGDLGWISGLG